MTNSMFLIIIFPIIFFLLKKCNAGHYKVFVKTLSGKRYLLIPFVLTLSLPADAQNSFPGKVVSSAIGGENLNSAAIIVLPDGTYIVSHSWSGNDARTSVLHSTDGGENWLLRTDINNITGATLFLHQNALYVMGTSGDYGDIIIRQSVDFGYNWTNPEDAGSGKLFVGDYNTKPVPVAIHNSRIWRSYNTRDSNEVIVSAPINSDLLNATNWEKSNAISFNPTWLNADNPNWSNGNVFVDKNNNLVSLAGVSSIQGANDGLEFIGGALGIPRYELSALINVSGNSPELYFNPCTDFIHFPGSHSKFTVRYDPVTEKYWSVINKISEIYSETDIRYSPVHQRNVLMLVSSSDLVHWTENAVVVSWNIGKRLTIQDKFGFQDVDWQFDGNDIIAVSSTAWYSQTNYEDANYITFHKITDFRTKEMFPLPEDLAAMTDDGNTFSESTMLLGWYMNSPDTRGNETELNAGLVNENIEPSKLTRGIGLSPDNFTRSFFSRFNYIGNPVNSKAYALENGAYFEFVLKPKEDVIAATLDTLKFKLRSGSNGPYYYRWLYSTDNWATSKELGIADGNINYLAASPDGIVQSPVILNGENSLQNIFGGTEVIFRLYVWGATNTNTSTISIGRSDAGAEPSVALSVIGRTLTTLPVNLISFKGEKVAEGIKLTWETASEKGSSHFDVLHSTEENRFNVIATLQARGSNTLQETYHYTDRNAVSGMNYYKLRLTDNDGNTREYGPINIPVIITDGFSVKVYSASDTGEIQLLINSSSPDNGILTISDITGRILSRQTVIVKEGETRLRLKENIYPDKFYVITYTSESKYHSVKFISK